MIYWTQALTHIKFRRDNEYREKYNLCLNYIIKLYPNMQVLLLKSWNFNDDDLVLENKMLSAIGKGMFWKAVDDALKFNIEKKEEHLARVLLAQKKIKDEMANQRRIAQKRPHIEENEDPVEAFFNRKWMDKKHNSFSGNRFMLPRIDRRH